MTLSADDQKRAAAVAALDLVEDGMALGLGTGSTAAHFVRALGERVAGGLSVRCAATSVETETLAVQCGIEILDLDTLGPLDLTVDGADEFDAHLRLIKGGGGALLREKIVAAASARMIVIADGSKLVDMLGAFNLPVEVIPFGLQTTICRIEAMLSPLGHDGFAITVREKGGAPFVTDSGNRILDLSLEAIPDPDALAAALNSVPGVVEHGLFIGLATMAFLGTQSGTVQRIDALSPSRGERCSPSRA